ncbi:hypothetical protein AAC03nite_28290 [Alicyclobacillus acidoterrestris]|nr:hypothetical protein AAC03nite_28290 [Alicyclobacillus acidoterrestris]
MTKQKRIRAELGERTTDEIVRQEWFYNDSNPPPWVDAKTLKRCNDIIRRWPNV